MKSLYLRSSLALACAVGLVACGGGDDNLLLGGYVFGLTKDGLELQNNGGPALKVPAGATLFDFPERVKSDSGFDVTIKTQPASSECKVINGKGKTGAFSIRSVEIHCTTNSYDLGGKITGLDGNATGLILINGSQRLEVTAGSTSFTMTTKNNDDTFSGQVPDGAPYGISVFRQPAGRTCSVANGTGTMGSAAVDNVIVTCI